MTSLMQDLRYAGRMLAKSPGFTIVAVVTLALGIGANTAVFSLIHGVLIAPLPYPESDRLVVIWEDDTAGGFPTNNPSVANFLDWKTQNTTLEDIAAHYAGNYNLTGQQEPLRLSGRRVTANLFRVLGVAPLHGRVFTDDEDQPEAERVVVLSYGLWQRVFGGAPAVLGRPIHLDGMPHTVVGIMPPLFQFPGTGTDLWTPTRFSAQDRANRGARYLTTIGRLKPAITVKQAQADLDTVMSRLGEEYPEQNRNIGVALVPLRDQYAGNRRAAYLTLLGAVGCLLLIACVNVANLVLARGSSRTREIAVRAALGAGRRRILLQLLTESLLLAAVGGVCGIVLGWWSFDFLSVLVPQSIAGVVAIDLNANVLAAALLATLLTAAFFGLLPALQVSRFDITRFLQQGGRSAPSSAGRRLRDTLVVAELALSVVLIIGAGLFLRSQARLQGVELGYEPQGVLTTRVDLPRPQYSDHARRQQFYEQTLERLRALPGVSSAGWVGHLPFTNVGGANTITVEGKPPRRQGEFNSPNIRLVHGDYLETMRIPLQRGRLLNENDGQDAPLVVVINEAMAEEFWPGEDPLGRRFKLSGPDSTNPWRTVVGVVETVRQATIDVPGRPQYYLPHAQFPWDVWFFYPRYLAVRTEGDPLALAEAVRSAVWEVNPDQPISAIRTMEQIVDGELIQRRVGVTLLSGFAVVALVLASLGIYGVLAYAVSQRTQEIGVRMALGAQRGEVLRMVLTRAFMLAVAGAAIGIAAAVGVGRLVASLLFEVSPTDAVAFGAAPLLLLAVALLAGFIPARRAARVDPMVALRYE